MAEVKLGQTDYSDVVFIPDPASTDGSGKTGLVAANLTVSYVRVETDNDVTVTDATSSLNDLSALTDAHNDWGIKEVSASLAPGLYRIDFADAVFASGAWTAVVYVEITSSAAAASPIKYSLVPEAPLDGVKTNSITANAITATAINADAITAAKLAADVTTEIQNGLATAAALATTDGKVDAILTDTAEIGTAGAGLTNINLPNQTMDIVGNITGNLSGSVGSVTGAVGSVTGNVGGNVTGTVGSVVGAVGSVTGNVGGNVTGTVGSVVGAVGSVTGAVGSVTGNVGGNVVGSVGSLTGHTVQTGDTYARTTKAIVTGTVGAASSTTSVVTSALAPAAAVTDQFKGRIIVFDAATTTANLRGQATDITASTSAGVLTVTALTTAPASGDTFTIL